MRWYTLWFLSILVYVFCCCGLFLCIDAFQEENTWVHPVPRTLLTLHPSSESEADDETCMQRITRALALPYARHIDVDFAPWTVPLDGPRELPYDHDVRFWNDTHVCYRGTRASMYVSQGPVHHLAGQGLSNCGLDSIHQLKKVESLDHDDNDTVVLHSNRTSVVVVADFVDAGYWGHAMENLWPRVAPLLGALASQRGATLTVVLPVSSILSAHTQQLADALGVTLQRSSQLPMDHDRFVWICDLPSYHPRLRSHFARMARGHLVAPLPIPPPRTIVFLSRSHGAKNGRNPQEVYHLEHDLATTDGIIVLDDIGAIPLRTLAQRIGSARGLAGVSGSAMFHMTWLPSGSDVWVLYPQSDGSQYGYLWLHAHSLGHRYHHVLNASVLYEELVEAVAVA